QGIGSIDFTAAARSVMQVMETKGGTKYLFHAKHNLTPKGDALAYQLVGSQFEWRGVLDEQEEENHAVNKKTKAVAQAERFLIDALKAGPLPASDLHEAAGEAGISLQSIQRAKEGIAFSRKDKHGWTWYLIGQEGHVAPPPADEMAGLIEEAQRRLREGS